MSSAQGQWRQRGPVRGGLGDGLVCADSVGGVSGGAAGAGSIRGTTRGLRAPAGASTPKRALQLQAHTVVGQAGEALLGERRAEHVAEQ
jgi:hypothetical protein